MIKNELTKDDLWGAVLAQIQLNISQASFNTWFKNTEILSIDESEVIISVPNDFAKQWFEEKYNKIILKIISEASQSQIKKISYLTKNKETKPLKKYNYQPVSASQLEFTELNLNKETHLNSKYTFDNFIIGPFNELPHAAAQAIIQNPGFIYNPLFIYGGVGLGKTHLIQAIGNEITKNFPDKKVKYLTTEKFTSEVISSIRNKSMEKFKDKYRSVDVFIIDDIQFLSGKEKTQEEFFHTFNVLYEKNKQVIISSDRPPRSIQALAERLRSRFEGGMTTDISLPDFETRIAILKTKSQERGISFSDDIYDYIATNIQKNIRELEGVLNKLIAHQKLNKEIINLKNAKIILRNILQSSVMITPAKIIKAVSNFYDIKEKELISSSRKKEIVKPRQIIMFILRKELQYSLPFIGKKLGGRDHTTVIHSCEKIDKEIMNNESLREEIELIKQSAASL